MIAERTGTLSGIKRHDYFPFGEEIMAGLAGRTTQQGYVTDSVRQQFTGQERDDEAGLDYFNARYHSSMQGRFTSVDPLMASAHATNPQSWNRYAYTLNNPLRYVDPTGMRATPPSASGTAGDAAREEYELEQSGAQQQQQTKCSKKGYCVELQEYGKQVTLSGENVNGKPTYGAKRSFVFNVYKDGKLLKRSTAKGITVEEKIVKSDTYVLGPNGQEKAPKNIANEVTNLKTTERIPLFDKDGRQAGDTQALFASSQEKYDNLRGLGVFSVSNIKFTVRHNGKEVASTSIESTASLTNVSVEFQPVKKRK